LRFNFGQALLAGEPRREKFLVVFFASSQLVFEELGRKGENSLRMILPGLSIIFISAFFAVLYPTA
jgi:hypothetical protein